MTDLDKLIDAVENGTATAPQIHDALGRNALHAISAYNGDMNAAKALHEALLPEWEWEIRKINSPEKTSYVVLKGRRFRDLMTSENQTPARAWLLAILKAYREETQK